MIVQNSKLNKLYAGSVNTLRFFTFFDGKETHILNTILKIGNNGFVDNFSSGDMYTFLDKKGKVIVPAIDQADNKIEVHPSTNEKIIGFTVPNFDKACKMVKEASKLIKEVKYIGWDVAILENDVCLVEGNEFPGVFQIKPSFSNNEHIGILPEYKKYVIDNFKGTKYEGTMIYGNWPKEIMDEYDCIKNVSMFDLGDEVKNAKYTLVYSQVPGFVTCKAYEMFMFGLLPFLHPDFYSIYKLFLICKFIKMFFINLPNGCVPFRFRTSCANKKGGFPTNQEASNNKG